MSELILNIVTPKGTYGPFRCDSVRLSVADNSDGKGGGSYGIRAGHTKSLLALDKGTLKAFVSGKSILTAKCGGGFAKVEKNTVTAVVDEYCEIN